MFSIFGRFWTVFELFPGKYTTSALRISKNPSLGVSDRNGPHSADIPETGRVHFRVFWENRSFSETTRWIPLKNEILSVPGVIEVWLIF